MGRFRITRLTLGLAVVSALALAGPPSVAHAAGGSPYSGTAAAVPGTVQAENYDTGGQGVAYNVTGTNGSANSYRSDGIDLEATTDTGGGYDVGWTATGQWFDYTVNVAAAGTYTVSLRLASPNGVTDGLHIANSSGTNLSGSVNVPATGGWQTWSTVTASVTLPAGQQTLVVDQDNGGWNLNSLAFAASASGIDTSAWYEVVNQNSGLCASAAGSGTAEGVRLGHRLPGVRARRVLLLQHQQQRGVGQRVHVGGLRSGLARPGDRLDHQRRRDRERDQRGRRCDADQHLRGGCDQLSVSALSAV